MLDRNMINGLKQDKKKEIDLLEKLPDFLDRMDVDMSLIKLKKGYRIPKSEMDKISQLIKDIHPFRNLINQNSKWFSKYGSSKDESKRYHLKNLKNNSIYKGLQANLYKILDYGNIQLILKLSRNQFDIMKKQSEDVGFEYKFHAIARIYPNGEKFFFYEEFADFFQGEYKVRIVKKETDTYTLTHGGKNKTYRFEKDEFYESPIYPDKLFNLNTVKENEVKSMPMLFNLDHERLATLYIMRKDNRFYKILNIEKENTNLEESAISKNWLFTFKISSLFKLKGDFEVDRNSEEYKRDGHEKIMKNKKDAENRMVKTISGVSSLIGHSYTTMIVKDLDISLFEDMVAFDDLHNLNSKV